MNNTTRRSTAGNTRGQMSFQEWIQAASASFYRSRAASTPTPPAPAALVAHRGRANVRTNTGRDAQVREAFREAGIRPVQLRGMVKAAVDHYRDEQRYRFKVARGALIASMMVADRRERDRQRQAQARQEAADRKLITALDTRASRVLSQRDRQRSRRPLYML